MVFGRPQFVLEWKLSAPEPDPSGESHWGDQIHRPMSNSNRHASTGQIHFPAPHVPDRPVQAKRDCRTPTSKRPPRIVFRWDENSMAYQGSWSVLVFFVAERWCYSMRKLTIQRHAKTKLAPNRQLHCEPRRDCLQLAYSSLAWQC